jgi:hypothetical protein
MSAELTAQANQLVAREAHVSRLSEDLAGLQEASRLLLREVITLRRSSPGGPPMTPRQQDGYLMLNDLCRRYCTDPRQIYFNNWRKAITDYSANGKQSLIDFAVDAANLNR